MKLKLIAFTAFMIFGCLFSVTFVYAQTINPFFCAKVMSYNILNIVYESENAPWEVRKEFVFDVVRETTPDLIGFQEDSVDQVNDLQSEFPDYQIIKAPISITSRENAYHSIFFDPTKFELISNGSFAEVNRARRNVNWAKLKEIRTGVQIFVINGHFLVPAPPEVRVDSAIQYATQIALLNTENAPIIMFGDLNDNLTSLPVQYLTSDIGTFPDLEYPTGFRRLITPTEWRLNISNDIRTTPITNSIDFVLTSEELTFSNPQQVNRSGFIDDDFFLAQIITP